MSPTTRIVLFNFWEYLAFVVNSLVFLLIGLDVNIVQIVTHLGPIAVAVLAVIVSRAIVVYGLSWLTRLRRPGLPLAYRHVLFWGGLRGAIGLALVLSLPSALPDRELLRIMAFGVVLFTLVGQGTTMQVLLRKLGLIGRAPEEAVEYERRHGRLMAARAARNRLEQLHQGGTVSATTWKSLAEELDQHVQKHLDAQQELLQNHPDLVAEERDDARREGLRAQRVALTALLNDGLISDQVYEELVAEVDAALSGAVEEPAPQTPVEPTPKDEATQPTDGG